MPKVKTSELHGTALDWAVCAAEGIDYVEKFCVNGIGMEYEATSPSTDWSQGGPIIGRGGISWHCGNKTSWHAYAYGSTTNYNGPTPLIAAMRCYVASKLGDEVEIPESLC